MSILETKKCPRKAFLRGGVPSGVIKSSILRSIAQKVLLNSDFLITQDNLKNFIEAAFLATPTKMFGFEKESERSRMNTLLWRYIVFEKSQPNNTILAQEFSNTVDIMGEKHDISAHRLIDRGTSIECIRCLYKAPDIFYRARDVLARADGNPDLLALQRCGEAELKKLGINKPCFGSFYYLKSKTDTSKNFSVAFEDSKGNNIVNYPFTKTDESNLKVVFHGVKKDREVCTENEKLCRNCIFILQVPHKLADFFRSISQIFA